MPTPYAVFIPLVNPNEQEALLAALHVCEGQKVAKGDLLAELETTKSNAELVADQSGYIRELQAIEGDNLRVGERLCWLTEGPNDPLPLEMPAEKPALPAAPGEWRISEPARTLAAELKVDLSQFPAGMFITRQMVEAAAANSSRLADLVIGPEDILVYGGGGHGKSLIELIQAAGMYRVIGVIDDGLPAGSQVLEVPVLGGGELLSLLHRKGARLAVNAVGGIGSILPRLKVFEKLTAAGFTCPNVIHPTAFLEPSARLAGGGQVMPFAYVGSSAAIGFGCIINTRATVSHDCILGDYVNLAPGSVLAGGVQVGERTLIGMNATVNLEVKIGAWARIGNGATVKSAVGEAEVVRAGTIWPVKS